MNKKDIVLWHKYLQDEVDATWLYRILSRRSQNKKEQEVFRELADIENAHAERWLQLMKEEGAAVPDPKPSLKARLMAWFTSFYGIDFLKQKMLQEEAREVKDYMDLYQKSSGATQQLALELARDSATHAQQLSDNEVEPWHSVGAGGMLRNVVYGFNDGLTANFGLIAGIIGAASDDRIILISGLAGMIADALSMGASGYLAAKSEQEVFEYEKEMERQELLLMPDLETQELIALNKAKGMTEEQAIEIANELMQDPEKALAEKVKEELQIGESTASPMKEGWITGTSTAVGALIPIAPFFFFSGGVAIWLAFSLAMLAHFAVGAVRSFFTGRSFWRSGFDMFAVGFGVAGIGYLIGEWVLKNFL